MIETMLFNSTSFLFFFLPVALFGFFMIGKSDKSYLMILWIICASLIFYSWWNFQFVSLLIGSICINYYIGKRIYCFRGLNERYKKLAMIAGIIFNLAVIGYFKYFNFFVDFVGNINGVPFPKYNIILPLGISFFTFQQIAFLVDVFRGRIKQFDFLSYVAFVSFFPQLIAGPIVHYQEIHPQLNNPSLKRFERNDLAAGITIFVIGLFKKVVIADSLALRANPVFALAEGGETLGFFTAWVGAFSFTLQLYFDFSGYSDMALGLGRMFGLRLPVNFDSPYRAASVIDFWRRWHITLSRFLRDYLYIPLGGNRKGRTRKCGNLMVTMLLGGLWHGAGWTFVFWGGLHGFYLLLNHGWRRVWRRSINAWWSVAAARFTTLFFVTVAWVFFRAESFEGASRVLGGMVNLPHTMEARFGALSVWMKAIGFQFQASSMSMQNYLDVVWLGIWIAVLWLVPNTRQIMRKQETVESHGRMDLLTWKTTRAWSVLVGMMTAISIMHLSQPTEFLYFQF